MAACGFANAKAPGYEADDFLAAAVAAEERRGGTALVASGDRDTFQLASDRTTILYPVRAGEMARIGPAEVRERYGVDPEQVPDFIALRGDPSDKLPGASGRRSQGGRRPAATSTERSKRHSRRAASRRRRRQLRLYRAIATMDAQGAAASARGSRRRPGPRQRLWRATGSSTSWPTGSRRWHDAAPGDAFGSMYRGNPKRARGELS